MDHHGGHQPQSRVKDRKTGKKTRWGSDDDRVPYNQIVLLQAASAIQQMTQMQANPIKQITIPSFYNALTKSVLEATTAMKPMTEEPKEMMDYSQVRFFILPK